RAARIVPLQVVRPAERAGGLDEPRELVRRQALEVGLVAALALLQLLGARRPPSRLARDERDRPVDDVADQVGRLVGREAGPPEDVEGPFPRGEAVLAQGVPRR